MTRNLIGTRWTCTDDDMPAFGLTGVVTDGDTNPEWNGENEISIQYEDGTTDDMKLRRFVIRHSEITDAEPAPVAPASIISLLGTEWKCTDEDMSEYGQTATVIDGSIMPDWNGENNIEIRYTNGQNAIMKLRRFHSRFKRINRPAPDNVIPFKPKSTKQNGVDR